ncbi:winged helix-turn-helix domain-containing protein [Serratia fonticola]|uniref:Winged helix-turn-helix domain-containing protein n=1 Tax=Serratia fonticola TaxID=47917 RepID=A0AAJ1YIK3_SERFO|nr:winged helix-turn-helix domain-containing protein [Serratia fonticola]MDQ9129887.1 winged helix-turn-helix domain-containing protein [Serratia fonticola]
MLTRYVIDSSFEFCPENCQLTIFGTENFIITLNLPASRCLELLLERDFNLVPQNDFYEYAWGDEAKTVSVNTLYQNVALLRKALKSISKKYDSMILTVPKQGFKFNKIFSVRKQAETEVAVPSPKNGITLDPLADPSALLEEDAEYPVHSRWQAIKTTFKEPLFYTSMALASVIIFSALYFSQKKLDSSPLSGYKLYSEDSEFITYANSNAHDITKKIELIKALCTDCKTSPYLYITAFKYSNRTSAIACPRPIKSTPSPECTTFNIIGGSANEN